MTTDDIYPLTLIKDRYNGAYSGGKWTAWPLHAWDVPYEPESTDGQAMHFWSVDDYVPIGRGDTPDEAIEDLRRRMAECNTWEI